jgi:aspartate aminotransferase
MVTSNFTSTILGFYFEIVKLSGGVPVEVPTSIDTDFTPAQLEAAITPKKK